MEIIANNVLNDANATVKFRRSALRKRISKNGATEITSYYVIQENIPEDAIVASDGSIVYNGVTYWTGSLNIKVVAKLVKAATGSNT